MWFGYLKTRARRDKKIDVNVVAIFFVKTTADVRQKKGRAVVSPQTCDKTKIRFLEVNLDEKNMFKIHWEFMCFWHFSEKFKKI